LIDLLLELLDLRGLLGGLRVRRLNCSHHRQREHRERRRGQRWRQEKRALKTQTFHKKTDPQFC